MGRRATLGAIAIVLALWPGMAEPNVVEISSIVLHPAMTCPPEPICTAGATGLINRRRGPLYSTGAFGGTFTGETPVIQDTGETPVPHLPHMAPGQYVAATLTLTVAPRPGTYRLELADAVYTTGDLGLFPVTRGEALAITVDP